MDQYPIIVDRSLYEGYQSMEYVETFEIRVWDLNAQIEIYIMAAIVSLWFDVSC